jgi:hypothetical protein
MFGIDSVFGSEPKTPPYQNSDSEDEILLSGELDSNSFTEVEVNHIEVETTKVFLQLLLAFPINHIQTLICPPIWTCPMVMKTMMGKVRYPI